MWSVQQTRWIVACLILVTCPKRLNLLVSADMSTAVSAYLTVQPGWQLEIGSQVNFTCTLSSSLANNVLYLALLTNATLVNIVQVYAVYQQATMSNDYAARVGVYIFDSMDAVVFSLSNLTTGDTGTYLCYVKTVYSTLADSNTVSLTIYRVGALTSTVVPTTISSQSTTQSNATNMTLAASSSGLSSTQVIIIAVCVSCVVGIALIATSVVLVVRYRARQRALKRRLQVFQNSRQQSCEEQPRGSVDDAQQSRYSRQSSNEAHSTAYAQPVGPLAAVKNLSTDTYYEPPCVVSKTRILQNAGSSGAAQREAVPPLPVRNRSFSPSAPVTVHGAQAADLQHTRGFLPSGTMPHNVVAGAQSTVGSVQRPLDNRFELTSVAPMPNASLVRASAVPTPYVPNSMQRIPSTASTAAMLTRVVDERRPDAAQIATGSLVERCDPPPSYNQLLLSNEAVAIFGDVVHIPRQAMFASDSVTQTVPDHFISNQIYNGGLADQKASRTN